MFPIFNLFIFFLLSAIVNKYEGYLKLNLKFLFNSNDGVPSVPQEVFVVLKVRVERCNVLLQQCHIMMKFVLVHMVLHMSRSN